MAVHFMLAQAQYFDDNGEPVSGAELEFFDATTTTPRAVYSDAGLTIAITQPIEADAAGVWPHIYLQNGPYKYRITDPLGNVAVKTVDNVDPGFSTEAGAVAVNKGGTGATTAAGARTNLGVYAATAGASLELRVDDLETEAALPKDEKSNTQVYAASFTPVFTTFKTRDVTLTGNITVNAPTVTDGQTIRLYLIQDATGSRIVTWNAAYKWPHGIVGLLSITANAVDVLEGHVKGSEIHVTSFKRQDVDLKRITGYYIDYDLGAIDDDATVTQAHGLGVYPSFVQIYLECTSTDNGFAVGQRMPVAWSGTEASDNGIVVTLDTTNVIVTFGVGFRVISRSTFNGAAFDESKWKTILRVFA